MMGGLPTSVEKPEPLAVRVQACLGGGTYIEQVRSIPHVSVQGMNPAGIQVFRIDDQGSITETLGISYPEKLREGDVIVFGESSSLRWMNGDWVTYSSCTLVVGTNRLELTEVATDAVEAMPAADDAEEEASPPEDYSTVIRFMNGQWWFGDGPQLLEAA